MQTLIQGVAKKHIFKVVLLPAHKIKYTFEMKIYFLQVAHCGKICTNRRSAIENWKKQQKNNEKPTNAVNIRLNSMAAFRH